MRNFVIASLLLAALVPPSMALADEAACRPSGHAPSTTGIVLLHGGLEPSYWTMPLKIKMEAAGFHVLMPEMPWSTNREYDRSYRQALDEVDSAAQALKSGGARRIVIAGFSIGANAALGYGALRDGVAGLVVIAPGQTPELPESRKLFAASVEKARQMVASGRGGQVALFKDFLQWHGSAEGARTTAENYLSYFDPDGDAVFPKNAARLKPGIPLLWIVGVEDHTVPAGPSYAFDKAPPNPLSRYVVIPKGHLEAPATGADIIVRWLRCL